MRELPIDFSEDMARVEEILEAQPALKQLVSHIIDQLKIITAGIRESIINEAELEAVDASIIMRFILGLIFQNYAISTEIYRHYHDYAPVAYEQMVNKLLKQDPEVLVNFLKLAKEDKEGALDYLDDKANASAEDNHKPKASPFES
jgi:hypothetical protein